MAGYVPPDFVLPTFSKNVCILGGGILDPTNQEDCADEMQAEEVPWEVG